MIHMTSHIMTRYDVTENVFEYRICLMSWASSQKLKRVA